MTVLAAQPTTTQLLTLVAALGGLGVALWNSWAQRRKDKREWKDQVRMPVYIELLAAAQLRASWHKVAHLGLDPHQLPEGLDPLTANTRY